MTQDERDLLVWVARNLAGLQFTDQRFEAPYVEALIAKIREAERVQQEQKRVRAWFERIYASGWWIR